MPHPHRESFLSRIAPGLLLAATGVGVGDLAGAGFAGKELGLAVLWAVAFGALLKFGLTEGIARWQLATGSSLVQGVARHVGRGALWTFLVYLVWWSYALSIAFATGCGIATHALLERAVPASALPSDPSTARFLLGAAHAVGGLLLVAIGGYRWFERIMEVAIATMFLVVISTAVAIQPDVGAILRGLFVPSIPDANGQGFAWTLVLLGGVGGTVTILGYGYWIREKGRAGRDGLRISRMDLAVGYTATAIFGFAMIIIGASVGAEKDAGLGLIVSVADRLERQLGGSARAVFLIGTWAAVFSSLLGVWQSIPLLFAECLALAWNPSRKSETIPRVPRWGFLAFLALAPLSSSLEHFQPIVRAYGIIGAAFLPFLTLALFLLNERTDRIGAEFKNRWPSRALLLLSLVVFTYLFIRELIA